jgi:uncharacterized phage protein (TIGR01671 family)
MRTIKFRGKKYKTGEWLVGDLIHFRNYVMILPLDADWFDFVPRKNNPFRLPSDRFVVDHDTVGQFTGLHDINGKEIYEGDLLMSHENGEVFEVVYDAPRFCFKDNDFGFRFLNHPEFFGVCGNVFDEQ